VKQPPGSTDQKVIEQLFQAFAIVVRVRHDANPHRGAAREHVRFEIDHTITPLSGSILSHFTH
jgi:hypothetical protein